MAFYDEMMVGICYRCRINEWATRIASLVVGWGKRMKIINNVNIINRLQDHFACKFNCLKLNCLPTMISPHLLLL